MTADDDREVLLDRLGRRLVAQSPAERQLAVRRAAAWPADLSAEARGEWQELRLQDEDLMRLRMFTRRVSDTPGILDEVGRGEAWQAFSGAVARAGTAILAGDRLGEEARTAALAPFAADGEDGPMTSEETS
ncbi:hypothetical protein [Microbacterium rhizophilus]|uniref:hypothetical protein n=1 Tax=Microbacterium rhizophilus TaxID=3138934 RepID=UPI0031EB8C97